MFFLLYTVGATVALVSVFVSVTVALVVATVALGLLLFAWATK